VGGGAVALSVGPYQFLPNLRARRPRLHRLLGRVYVGAVLATGIGAFGLARIALGGPMARLGFAVMAVAVLVITGLAVVAIRGGDVAAHRRWMRRSYAVIFSAVTFRLWLLTLTALGLPFDAVYAVGAWVAWMGNVMASDLLAGLVADGRSPRAPAAVRIVRHAFSV
jgi:uncharacterized membrane protein